MGQRLAFPVLLLAVALLGLAVVLIISGNRKRLAARVDLNTTRGIPAYPVATRPGADVRLRVTRHSRWRFLTWALRMPIAAPAAQLATPSLVLALITLGAVVAAWSSHLMASWGYSIAGAALMWIIVTRGIFGWQMDRYRSRLLRQLPDTIHLVISATRAGLPVSESFRTVMQEMPEPTKGEFARVVDEMAVGVAADEALLNLHRRTKVTEYAIFAVTIGVQARSGGRLAETITNLAETVRDRLAIAGKARALSAEARAAGVIMTMLPVISGLMLSVTRPGYLAPLFSDPRGQTMLATGVVLLILGTITMRQMIKGAIRD
jgi:tight adherence protein B